jgi:hypothetical protein
MPVEWAKDEIIASCGPLARLLFYHLHSIADRQGRLEDRPKRIAVECLPYDDVNVDNLLDELHHHGLIVRYEVAGARYLAIPTFLVHQSPHLREAISRIPGIPAISESLGQGGARSVQGECEHETSPPVSVLGSVSVSKTVPESVSVTVSPQTGASAEAVLLKLAKETLDLTTTRDMTELLDSLKWHVNSTNSKTMFTNEEAERALRIALADRASLTLNGDRDSRSTRRAG